MKRYVKPDLYYENFELSRSVASCSYMDIKGSDLHSYANFHNGETCTFNVDGDILFNESTCDKDYSIYEGYCYQKSTEGLTLFSS